MRWLSGTILMLLAGVAAAEPRLEVDTLRIRPQAYVQGSQATLGDVLILSRADPQLRSAIGDVPVVNSTNTISFVSGIVWDTSDGGDGQYDGTEDAVFVTTINESQAGKYGVYDYEIRVPVRLRDYTSGSSTVAFYGEIR